MSTCQLRRWVITERLHWVCLGPNFVVNVISKGQMVGTYKRLTLIKTISQPCKTFRCLACYIQLPCHNLTNLHTPYVVADSYSWLCNALITCRFCQCYGHCESHFKCRLLGALECWLQVNVMVTTATHCGRVVEFLMNWVVGMITFQTHLARFGIVLWEKMWISDVHSAVWNWAFDISNEAICVHVSILHT